MSEPPRLPSTLKHKLDEASGRCQWAMPVEADSVVTLTVPQGLRLCGRGAAAWKIMREWANATKPILAFLALPWFPECKRRSRRKWLTLGQKCRKFSFLLNNWYLTNIFTLGWVTSVDYGGLWRCPDLSPPKPLDQSKNVTVRTYHKLWEDKNGQKNWPKSA